MVATGINEALLDQKLAELEQARQWSPRVISKLETMIRTADDYDLFRINPLKYAADKTLSENEAIDLFLYGAKVGLFEMDWHLICPSCGTVVESFAELDRLHPHVVCNACGADVQVSLDDYIQVTFTIVPGVREIAYHHPGELQIKDYIFRYHRAKGILPLPSGETAEEFGNRTTLALAYLEPGEKRNFQMDVGPDIFHIMDLNRASQVTLVVAHSSDEAQPVQLQVDEDGFRVLNQAVESQQTDAPSFTRRVSVGQVRRGQVILEIENAAEQRCPLWVMNFPENWYGGPVQFEPFLSGKRLLTTQTFRDLFRSEIVQTDEGIGVKDITFLFTDLKGSTAMYEQIGDPKAFFLVRQHFDTLGRVIADNSGAIVKTIGDAVMASFSTPADAVRAALGILQDIEDFNRNISQKLILKIGIHRGHSIVVTLNDWLDYFGQTVNIASRVQGLAEASEIYLTEEIYSAPGVQEVVATCEVLPEAAMVKGVSEKINVYKVTVQMRKR
jgi:class 3 adenylate cyclase